MIENGKINPETQALSPEATHEILTPQECLHRITSNIGDIQDRITKLQVSLDSIHDTPKYSEISQELTKKLEILSGQSVQEMRIGIDDLIINLSQIG